MSQEVNLKFTINDKGAPVIKVTHDKNSDDISQKLLGVFFKAVKSNNNQLSVEVGKEFADGQVEYEIKVLGS